MGGKRQRSMIGKLSELLVSGSRAGFLEATISPRSPLDMKIHSPRCIKNYDHAGGVGLGIVAALEKSSDSDREILGKFCVRCPRKTPSRDPIPVNDSEKSCGEIIKESFEDMEMDDLEDYTYVICHGPNQSFAKVYYDGGDESIVSVDSKVVHGGITDPILTIEEEEQDGGVFPTLEYLSSCFLCGKKLHGEDIYMYREKAFCSMDCRSKQITNEERKEVCRSGTPRATDPSDSPCAERKSFAAGILAV